MGFLKRLFGGQSEKPYVDKEGIYFYVKCSNCGTIVRLRAHKTHDLNRDENGLVWHKTIVDSKCFRRISAVVRLNNSYQTISQEIAGGEFVTEADYLAWESARAARQSAKEETADNEGPAS